MMWRNIESLTEWSVMTQMSLLDLAAPVTSQSLAQTCAAPEVNRRCWPHHLSIHWIRCLGHFAFEKGLCNLVKLTSDILWRSANKPCRCQWSWDQKGVLVPEPVAKQLAWGKGDGIPTAYQLIVLKLLLRGGSPDAGRKLPSHLMVQEPFNIWGQLWLIWE